MAEFHTPGWTADWINAWLAAIGVCVLLDDMTLRWTDDPRPHAVFSHPEIEDLVAAIDAAIPTVDELNTYAIARELPGLALFTGKVSQPTYADRASIARAAGDFSLGVAVTDVANPKDDGHLQHSAFDPASPGSLTLHTSFLTARDACDQGALASSMRGASKRILSNGLGFDYQRIHQAADPNCPTGKPTKWIDPSIETLALFGLMLLPVRGDGNRAVTRGWTGAKSRRGALLWPAWRPAFDLSAIDGFLDRFWGSSARADVHIEGAFQVVPYKKIAVKDLTVGFGSERVQ